MFNIPIDTDGYAALHLHVIRTDVESQMKTHERISTRYLLLVTSFMAGALVTIKAFEYGLSRGLTVSVFIKVGICLSLFATSCFLLNRKNYFSDAPQRQRLMSMNLSFIQGISALGVLCFWSILKLIFFGV